MASSRHLTDHDIEKILEIIDAWSINRKFGWELLRQAIQRKFQFSSLARVWSRVQLAKYPSIKSAYDAFKLKQRAEKPVANPEDADLPPDLRLALDTVNKLENKIQRLETTNHRLYEQFEKWLYNARAHGLTEDVLDKPLCIHKRSRRQINVDTRE